MAVHDFDRSADSSKVPSSVCTTGFDHNIPLFSLIVVVARPCLPDVKDDSGSVQAKTVPICRQTIAIPKNPIAASDSKC